LFLNISLSVQVNSAGLDEVAVCAAMTVTPNSLTQDRNMSSFSLSATRWAMRTFVGAIALIGFTVMVGASYEGVMRRRAVRDFPAPGVMVDVDHGRRLQLDCRGSGSPTVVFEAGLDNNGSLAWSSVHDSIAKTTRACAYSRPGIMWSDPVSGPFDVTALQRDLHMALVSSGESAPWVMVGHSIGGPLVMMFTKLYDAEVVGLVLVDPTHPDQFARFREATGKSLQPPPAIVRLGAALAWTGLVRALPDEPHPTWPATLAQAPAAFLPISVAELAREVEGIPVFLDQTRPLRALGDRPLIVLSAMQPQPAAELRANGITAAEGAAVQGASRALHEEQAHWSTQGRHELVAGASHYVQFDRPDAVIAAVRSVIAMTRHTQ
jgi:pimeloyl-ACP methyl ester carboxylesterase